jgi:hypothetical protein
LSAVFFLVPYRRLRCHPNVLRGGN